jgi:DNA-binding winged helix-turn-helix (wHTH) protein/Tol biopolymer transport system component
MLRYFVNNPGKDISRDDLMAAVWPNQVVSENAINRIVVQLRKALSDTARIKRYIVTVPKVGYRFIADCRQVEEEYTKAKEQPTNTLTSIQTAVVDSSSAPVKMVVEGSTKAINKTTLPAFALLIVALAIFSYQLLQTTNSTGFRSLQISPLTRYSETEYGAVLASDNLRLVYTTWVDEGYNVVMYQPNSSSQPKRISQTDGNAFNPIWSQDGSQLIYLYQNKISCEFHIIRFENAQPTEPTKIYTCPKQSYSNFAFSNDNQILYFTERQSQYSPYNVYKLDIANATKSRLAQPEAVGYGNYYLDINKKNNQLLLVNESRVGKSSVFSLNPAEQSYEKLTDLDYRIDSAIWGHEPKTIVHPGIHPAYQLVQTNIENAESNVLLSDTRRISYPKRINNNKDYLFTSYIFNRDLVLNEPLPSGINSSVMDYIPAISHDEQYIAFVSKRSGYSQVWLYSRNDGELAVVDNINDGRMFYSLDWSFDGTRLLANTSLGLLILNVQLLKVEQEVPTESTSYASNWYSNNELTYSIRKADKWQVYKYNLDSKSIEQLDDNWAFVISNKSSSLQVNQRMELIGIDNTTNYAELCGPLIDRYSFTIRFNESGFYCPAKDDGNDLIYIDSSQNIHRLEGALQQAPFYSVTESLIANIELKDSVSDIMRTNFTE